MPVPLDEIITHIRLGEDSSYEFKELRFAGNRFLEPTRDHLAKELSAMANAVGGKLVLGVRDKTREIIGIGLDKLDLVEDTLREVSRSSVTPPLSVDIFRYEVPDADGDMRAIIVVEVERGLFVHGTKEGYFRRTGSGAIPMDSIYLARLNQERSLVGLKRFEQLPVPHSEASDLEKSLWKAFVSRFDENDTDALVKRNLLVSGANGQLQPSVAGILMGTSDPRKWLPNAFIQAVRYRGIEQDSHFQVDAKDLSGPLNAQIANAMAFFRLNQRVGATKDVDRTETPQFNERAVFEALVNAVAHRDYQIDHSKIRFFIFDDRLEIYSPGSLINSMSVESLPVRTATRNELLTNLLAECELAEDSKERIGRGHLMERRGDGIQIIQRETQRTSGQPARFEIFDEAEFRVTIPAASPPNQK